MRLGSKAFLNGSALTKDDEDAYYMFVSSFPNFSMWFVEMNKRGNCLVVFIEHSGHD